MVIKQSAALILAFIATIFFSHAFSQDYNIKWSEKTSSKGAAYAILPLGGSDFYAMRQIGSRMFPQFRVSSHENFVQTRSKKVYAKANGSAAIIEGQQIIDGKFVAFLSDRHGDKKLFFMQEYDKELLPKGRAIKLAEYTIVKGSHKGYFDVVFSRNKDFFAIVWTIPGKRENSDSYGYKVFDNDFVKVSEGTYTMPFDGNLTGFTYKYLSGTGDLFLAVSEYEAAAKNGLFKQYTDYKAMHLYHVTPEGIDEYEMKLDGRRIESMTMNSDNDGIFSIVGVYGERDSYGVAGIFNVKLDFFKRELLNEKFNKFSQDFVTQDWSERDKEKADRRKARGRGEPELYRFLMRQTEVMPDGSVIGSMEQYYTVTRTSTDTRGVTNTSTYYYYNDIVAFKIDQDGSFDWVKKINKYQMSANDGGPYSSYSRFVDNGNIVFIFNDNEKNYDEKGDFVGSPRGSVYPATFTRRKNAVAIVSLDGDDGVISRKTFFNREEVEAIAVPKMFNVDYNNKEVLLYTTFRTKERFGLLKLED